MKIKHAEEISKKLIDRSNWQPKEDQLKFKEIGIKIKDFYLEKLETP